MTKQELASFIDHTLLSPEATEVQIRQLCNEALRYGFASVCVNPFFVKIASEELLNSNVKTCTVIGFPLGAVTTKDKVFEAKNAIKNGADEIDMVVNLGLVKSENWKSVKKDISAVVKVSRQCEKILNKKIIVKVILETCFLTDEQIVKVCECSKQAGADFVKTSTGFANPKGIDGNALPNGASEYHVKLMRKTVGNSMGVKASGGIRNARMAELMLKAGANRLGTSSGVSIVENWIE